MFINRKNKYILLVSAICFFILILSFFSEKSDLFKGIGSDGLSISHFVPDLLSHLEKKEYFSEAGTRLLPMLITHVFYEVITFFRPDELTGIMFGDFKINISQNIVLTLEIINTILLCLSVIIFSLILYQKNTSFRIFLFCSSLFYLNFMFLKQFFFEPVFFDQFYLFYSMLLLLSIQSNIKWLQYVLLFFSIYVSSLSFIFCALLLFNSYKSNFRIKISKKIILVFFTTFYMVMFFYLLKNPLCTESLENKTIYSLSYISLASTLIYIWILIFTLVPNRFSFRFSNNMLLYATCVTSIIVYKFIIYNFTFKANLEICNGLPENILTKILNNFRQVDSRPLGFLSSHFNYFGLLVIFIFTLGESAKKFLESNEKFIPLIIFFIFSSLTAESRYLTTFIPFLLVMIFDNNNLSNNKFKILLLNHWVFMVMIYNIIWSGFYLKINPLDTNTYLNIIRNSTNSDKLFTYPLQKYFKHLGPWTSNESYLWQLSVFFLTLIFFIVCYKIYDISAKKKYNI